MQLDTPIMSPFFVEIGRKLREQKAADCAACKKMNYDCEWQLLNFAENWCKHDKFLAAKKVKIKVMDRQLELF